MNPPTEEQKAEWMSAIRQHEQELCDIRSDPVKYLQNIQLQVNMFNAAIGSKLPVILRIPPNLRPPIVDRQETVLDCTKAGE